MQIYRNAVTVKLYLILSYCYVQGGLYTVSEKSENNCTLREVPDEIIADVKTKQECVLRCAMRRNNACLRTAYYREIQVCHLYENEMPGPFQRYSDFLRGSYISSKLITQVSTCPDSFTFIAEINTCLRLIDNQMTWDEGQCLCNSVHSKSHLVVINSNIEQKAISTFLMNATYAKYPSCFGTAGSESRIWTAGQRIVPLTMTRYVWKAYPGMYTEFSNEANNLWYPGEPNKVTAIESCVQLWQRNLFNDLRCHATMCSMCQMKPKL